MGMRALTVMAVVALFAAPAAAQQAVAWSLATAMSGGRAGHAVAFDSRRGVTVLVGGVWSGSAQTGVYDQTLEWNGLTWSLRQTGVPSGRYGHAMAFDSARGVTVLFGGGSNDTWEWAGASWMPRNVPGPSSRSNHAMAYNSARAVTVLFGGSAGGDETWEWDGATWTQRAVSGPSPRTYHGMAYDSARGVTVLFGGMDPVGVFNGETWEWNGSAWAQRNVSGPSPRGAPLAYDAGRRVTVLSGGYQGGWSFSQETWEWDGSTWTQRRITGIRQMYFHATAYDSARGSVVLVGGTWHIFNGCETWELLADSDGDGLCDEWEISGGVPSHVLWGGTVVRVPLPGANPLRKDLYVEFDRVNGAPFSAATTAMLEQAFIAAPVTNPDLSTGITLHIQVDDFVGVENLSLVSAGFWPSSAAPIKQSFFGTSTERGDEFAFLLLQAKARAYRYCIGYNRATTGVLGLAEPGGDDSAIFLGSLSAFQPADVNIAAAFMHQLGHNLGLRHGGGDEVCGKPNYPSIMNFPLALRLPWNASFWRLDFSREQLATLNESSLDESQSLGSGGTGFYSNFRMPYAYASFNPQCHACVAGRQCVYASLDPLTRTDLNLDCSFTGLGLALDLNHFSQFAPPLPGSSAPSPAQELKGYNDWDHLLLPPYAAGYFYDSFFAVLPAGDELTESQAQAMVASFPPACFANCDNSTGNPLLTANDFVCFINAFVAGCG